MGRDDPVIQIFGLFSWYSMSALFVTQRFRTSIQTSFGQNNRLPCRFHSELLLGERLCNEPLSGELLSDERCPVSFCPSAPVSVRAVWLKWQNGEPPGDVYSIRSVSGAAMFLAVVRGLLRSDLEAFCSS